MDIGIFSGSFNPVHIGHLALANYLCEYEGLDEIWFMVTPHNPLKEETLLMDDALRLKLVRLAIAGYPKFRASDFEFHLPRPSYTVHTLDKLKEAYPQDTFHLIIGADNWALFPRWYQSERILAENPILIYPRPGCVVDEETLPQNVKLASSPTFEIRQSSAYGLRTFHPSRVIIPVPDASTQSDLLRGRWHTIVRLQSVASEYLLVRRGRTCRGYG